MVAEQRLDFTQFERQLALVVSRELSNLVHRDRVGAEFGRTQVIDADDRDAVEPEPLGSSHARGTGDDAVIGVDPDRIIEPVCNDGTAQSLHLTFRMRTIRSITRLELARRHVKQVEIGHR
ncbi:hypothetical protein [Sphingomonas baiyangensis]